MQEDTATGHLVHFVGISDMNGRGADEPYIAVHTPMIGKVELCLFLSRWITFVIAVVGFYGNQTGVTSLEVQVAQVVACEMNGDGEVATEMFLYEDTVDIHLLLSHDGFEIDRYVLALHVGGHSEMLPIPYYALIVAATAGFAGHKHGRMGCTDHFPFLVVE